MAGVRDRYAFRDAKQEAAATQRRAWVQDNLQRHAEAAALTAAANDPTADTPGTWSNTLLTAFVAEPATNDPKWHPFVVRWGNLRACAWDALGGTVRQEYERQLAAMLARDAVDPYEDDEPEPTPGAFEGMIGARAPK